MPWQNVSVLGTTDDDYFGDLDDVVATSDEVRYLFQAVARVFPSIWQARAIGTWGGVRPTLYENYARTIESHILDFDSNVYGDTVRLYFHKLLRREQQFRSALELTNQIRQDIARSRMYFLTRQS